MMFSDTYRAMNQKIGPSPALAAETAARARPRRRGPRRPVMAAVLVLCLCAAAPAAAAVEPVYQALYRVAPAAAQFFQPVRRSCTDNGVTLEVVSVHVEGSTARAYIALSGNAVDSTCDLYDSYDFHLPFDQISHCERVEDGLDAHTATFLCTVETMDGAPIPAGGKMTFSLDRFLSGKQTAEDLAVDLVPADYAGEAPARQVYVNGASYDPERFTTPPDNCVTALVPGDAITTPMENLSITAAGYADGLFHVQMAISKQLELDPHGQLYLVGEHGERVEPYYTISTIEGEDPDGTYSEARISYVDFVFDISPADLSRYALHGDFHTAASLTEGDWRITFPLN